MNNPKITIEQRGPTYKEFLGWYFSLSRNTFSWIKKRGWNESHQLGNLQGIEVEHELRVRNVANTSDLQAAEKVSMSYGWNNRHYSISTENWDDRYQYPISVGNWGGGRKLWVTKLNIPYLQATELWSWAVGEKCHFFHIYRVLRWLCELWMTNISIPYLQGNEMVSWAVGKKCHYFTPIRTWHGGCELQMRNIIFIRHLQVTAMGVVILGWEISSLFQIYMNVCEYFNSFLPPQKRLVWVSYLQMLITNEPWFFFYVTNRLKQDSLYPPASE